MLNKMLQKNLDLIIFYKKQFIKIFKIQNEII